MADTAEGAGRRGARRVLGLVALLVACSGGAEPEPSRGEALADRWTVDPDGVIAELEAEPDPLVRTALALAVAEAHPGTSRAVCATVPAGVGRDQCEAINVRVHLNTEAPSRFTEAKPMGGASFDPTFTRLVPQTTEAPAAEALAATPPVAVDCGGEETERTCRLRVAWERALAGASAREVAGVCAGLSEARWQGECRFAAAEAGFEAQGASWAEPAVSLCLAGTTFRTQCLTHLAMKTGRHPDWAFVVPAAEAVSGALEDWDPDLAARWRGRTWAEAAGSSLREAEALTGDLLEQLPEDAAPHVRASVAWRLLELEEASPRDLAGWSTRLTEVLSERPGAAPARYGRPPAGQKVRSLWRAEEGDAARPRVGYLGTAWRGYADDPVIDGLICLLEAAARLERDALLAQGADHADPVVRWTAERLTRTLAAAAGPAAGKAAPARGRRP